MPATSELMDKRVDERMPDSGATESLGNETFQLSDLIKLIASGIARILDGIFSCLLSRLSCPKFLFLFFYRSTCSNF